MSIYIYLLHLQVILVCKHVFVMENSIAGSILILAAALAFAAIVMTIRGDKKEINILHGCYPDSAYMSMLTKYETSCRSGRQQLKDKKIDIKQNRRKNMTDMMTMNMQDLEAVAGGEEHGSLPEYIVNKMNLYERYTYDELYRRVNNALAVNDIADARKSYSIARSWELDIKRKYS